jgi:hypothetical protein
MCRSSKSSSTSISRTIHGFRCRATQRRIIQSCSMIHDSVSKITDLFSPSISALNKVENKFKSFEHGSDETLTLESMKSLVLEVRVFRLALLEKLVLAMSDDAFDGFPLIPPRPQLWSIMSQLTIRDSWLARCEVITKGINHLAKQLIARSDCINEDLEADFRGRVDFSLSTFLPIPSSAFSFSHYFFF